MLGVCSSRDGLVSKVCFLKATCPEEFFGPTLKNSTFFFKNPVVDNKIVLYDPSKNAVCAKTGDLQDEFWVSPAPVYTDTNRSPSMYLLGEGNVLGIFPQKISGLFEGGQDAGCVIAIYSSLTGEPVFMSDREPVYLEGDMPFVNLHLEAERFRYRVHGERRFAVRDFWGNLLSDFQDWDPTPIVLANKRYNVRYHVTNRRYHPFHPNYSDPELWVTVFDESNSEDSVAAYWSITKSLLNKCNDQDPFTDLIEVVDGEQFFAVVFSRSVVVFHSLTGQIWAAITGVFPLKVFFSPGDAAMWLVHDDDNNNLKTVDRYVLPDTQKFASFFDGVDLSGVSSELCDQLLVRGKRRFFDELYK